MIPDCRTFCFVRLEEKNVSINQSEPADARLFVLREKLHTTVCEERNLLGSDTESSHHIGSSRTPVPSGSVRFRPVPSGSVRFRPGRTRTFRSHKHSGLKAKN